MPIHKVIYRLDFEPNFDIIDSTGKILRIIKDAGNGEHWPDLGESPDSHSVSGRNSSKKDGWWSSISIEPTAIIGDFESILGVPIEQLENSKFISRLFKITNTIRQEFQINTFKRIGFRLFFFAETDMDREATATAFQTLLDENLSDDLLNILGKGTDYGIALDGHHEDGLQYHLKFGPYTADEFNNYLPKISQLYINTDKLKERESNFTITMDLDLYEHNYYLSETTNFSKWCFPVLAKGSKTIEAILHNITNKIGG